MQILKDEKAVILARVSTCFQANEGTSLDDQTDGGMSLAGRMGWGIHAVYREDGVSGGLYATRSALQSALQDIEARRASVFVTHAVDRSGRDVEVLSQIRRRVLEAGGRFFLSSGQEFPATPDGSLMFNVFAGFAQYEKDSIRKRTVGGRIRRARDEGRQPSRTLSPYAYRVVTKADVLLGNYPSHLLGTYQIITDKAQWAKGAYSRFSTGASMRDIRRWFKENDVLTAEGLPEWSLSSIRRLLSNPVYKGKPVFGRTKRKVDEGRVGRIGYHGKPLIRVDYTVPCPEEEWIILEAEPMVTEGVWDECQRRLAENKSKLGGNPKRKYTLGGMVVCPLCGKITGGQTGSNKNHSRYYRCVACKWTTTATHAEALATHAVVTLAERPELIASALKAYDVRHKVGADQTVEPRLKDELARLEKKQGAAFDAELEARTDDPSQERDMRVNAFRQKQREIAARTKELLIRLNAMQESGNHSQQMLTDTQKVAVAVASVREALESEHLTPVEKNEILSKVVGAIKPNQDNSNMVLALRPFFSGFLADTVPQILIRVTASTLSSAAAPAVTGAVFNAIMIPPKPRDKDN